MMRRQPHREAKCPWPTIWLMTDPRFGDDLLPAIQQLPFGSGVIFRHYQLLPPARQQLFNRVRSLCRRRGHVLLLAGSEQAALRWRADGFHGRSGIKRSKLVRSAPVHNRRELREAVRNKADLVLISPLFETASHVGKSGMGRLTFNALARQSGTARVVALGGLNKPRARSLNRNLIHGWAAIDAFRN